MIKTQRKRKRKRFDEKLREKERDLRKIPYLGTCKLFPEHQQDIWWQKSSQPMRFTHLGYGLF